MSDKHSSHNTADTQEITPQGNLDELDTPPADDTHQTELELAQPEAAANAQAAEDNEWEAVPLPGTLNLAADKSPANEPANQPTHTVTTERETELLTLIHDLNECNDVLLARISQLEGELEKTHTTLKTELDKASFAQEKMAKQVSAEQTSAQQVSQNAQQQVGKLVGQLETNEALLNRQQLINENLQTELTNSQERITQLERECALASQQYADEAKARVNAETTNRDLRSRLQRQQRYTLQFKAALEKSLTVSTRSANHSANHFANSSANNPVSPAQPVSFNTPAATPAVTMPKAQQIMPWAAAATAPFQGIDPHLETLIRNAGKPTNPTNIEEPKPSTLIAEPTEAHTKVTEPSSTNSIPTDTDAPTTTSKTADSEAEAKLWQDLERVINTAAETKAPQQPAVEIEPQALDAKTLDAKTIASKTAAPEKASDTAAGITPEPTTDPKTTPPAKPKFNWQNAVKTVSTKANASEIDNQPGDNQPEDNQPSDDIAATSKAQTEIAAKEIVPVKETIQAKETVQTEQRIATPIPPLSQQPAAQQAPFTEPSPWGKPLPETVPTTTEKAALPPLNTDYLPALDSTAGSAISPVVNPLRTQKKKVGSLAAVELPTFQTAKAGSFKR